MTEEIHGEYFVHSITWDGSLASYQGRSLDNATEIFESFLGPVSQCTETKVLIMGKHGEIIRTHAFEGRYNKQIDKPRDSHLEDPIIFKIAKAMAEISNGGNFSDEKFYGTTRRQVWISRARVAFQILQSTKTGT